MDFSESFEFKKLITMDFAYWNSFGILLDEFNLLTFDVEVIYLKKTVASKFNFFCFKFGSNCQFFCGSSKELGRENWMYLLNFKSNPCQSIAADCPFSYNLLMYASRRWDRICVKINKKSYSLQFLYKTS